jgi:protein-S-isoprenylcysteine O-methyltransferase Ste14
VTEQTSDSPGVAVFPPILFAATLGLGVLLHWIWPVAVGPPLIVRLLGLVILVASGVLARAAEKAMRRAGTNIRPDQPTLAIATDGPFRFTRNPLYLASVGLYLGIALLVNALWPLVLVPPMLAVLDWGVIRREERYLEAKFGPSYREYRARVRRWL